MGSPSEESEYDRAYWNERYEHLSNCEECGEVLEFEEGDWICDDCYNDEEED